MDDAATKWDVAMDLVTLLFLGGQGHVFSDSNGSLEKAIASKFSLLPATFKEFFGSGNPETIKGLLGDVLSAATELDIVVWVGDELNQFEIKFDDKNAALRAAAIDVPVQTLQDIGHALCHSISAEAI